MRLTPQADVQLGIIGEMLQPAGEYLDGGCIIVFLLHQNAKAPKTHADSESNPALFDKGIQQPFSFSGTASICA